MNRSAGVRITLLLATGMLGACSTIGLVTDQAQVDALTYCDVDHGVHTDQRDWGRRDGKRTESGPMWSHFSLGTFACKTQDQWLSQARGNGAVGEGAGTELENERDKILWRNDTQTEMMIQSDRLCDRHLASIFGTHTGTNLQLDLLTSLFSGGSALASGNSARNLAGASAFAAAGKSQISANVYQGQVATAINLVIRNSRNAIRQTIRGNQSCSAAAYPAAQAVQDALVYHNACSFEFGLSELLREASSTGPTASVAAAEVTRLKRDLADAKTQRSALADDATAEDRQQLVRTIATLEDRITIYNAFGVSAAPVAPVTPVATEDAVDDATGDGGDSDGAGAGAVDGAADGAGAPAAAKPSAMDDIIVDCRAD